MPPVRAALPLLLCAGCLDFRACPPVDEASLALLPDTLSATGLYADIDADTVAADVIAFSPRFPLWTDGAEKRRWILLPGAVDAADPDAWRFPEGTRAWKEFARDGVRVETRMIEKVGPGDADWIAAAYLWEGADATLLPAGAADANGTDHDIPTAEECGACHGGRASFVLGFSAVQLAGATPPEGGYDLDRLVAEGRVDPDPGAISVPGEVDTRALGYLHANCSHCHNPERRDAQDDGAAPCYTPDVDLDFTLPAARLASIDDTPALQTARSRLDNGNPDNSEIVTRMSQRSSTFFPSTMPPLGTEVVDEEGVALLKEWIGGM